MASILEEAAAIEFSARQPWPDDVTLFQPYEARQILLSDFASVVSVKTYLKMAGLDYNMQLRANAEYMSPSGKVPFIKAGPVIISELEPIAAFVSAKGHGLSSGLSEEQLADMKAYIALVHNVLYNAEQYMMWVDKEMFQRVTKPRYGHPHAWPLSVVLPLCRRYNIKHALKANGWAHKTLTQVYEEMETCCRALSEKLGDQAYFLGDSPTELDALVFGHLYTLVTIKLPDKHASHTVCKFENLVNFCRKLEKLYFKETELERHHEDRGDSE